MLVYAIYRRNTHQGAGWERHWYTDDGDFYLGTGWPESLSAGPTADLKGRMSRAFVLASDPIVAKEAANDTDVERLNELLKMMQRDEEARREVDELRRKLANKYSSPAPQSGVTLFAAVDDEYHRRAWEVQTGGDSGFGVRHTVPKTMLAAIFTDEANARSFSAVGTRTYTLTPDKTPLKPDETSLKTWWRRILHLRP